MEQKYKPYIMYKITCNDNENLIYIGSTTNFKCRKSTHKHCYNNEKSKKYNFKIYQNIRENGGWINFTMKPIEMYYADSKIKAKIRENELMEVFNSNLNDKRAYTSVDEKQLYNKEYKENNKDKLKEYHKKYDDEYYQKNKENLKTDIIICDCGSELRKDNLKRHLQSKKHQKLLLK